MAYGADVVLQQFAFINAAALRNGISFLAEQTLFPSQSTAPEKGSLQILQCQGIGGSTGQRNRIWAFWSSLAYFGFLSTALELYAVHGLHGIDVAHLETTTSLLLSHLTRWLLIGPKQCNFKRRQSWALHTETLSTTKEYPCCSLKSDNRCGKDSYAVPTVQLLTTVEFLLTEICWNFFDLPRTRFWILLYSVVSAGLWLKPSGARLVWSSFNEGSDKGNDERALMRLHDLSQLLAFYTLLRWPQTPCHQAHTCRCACHVLLSFDFGRRVDPVRFSLIFRFPMAYGADIVLQQLAFINAAALRNGISFLAEQTLFPSQSTAREKGSLQILQCQGIGGSTGQRNRIWAFWSSLAYFVFSSTAVELYAVHGLHGIDVALLETTTSLLLSHLTRWLLIGPKQCNFKRRQSWALHIEAIPQLKNILIAV